MWPNRNKVLIQINYLTFKQAYRRNHYLRPCMEPGCSFSAFSWVSVGPSGVRCHHHPRCQSFVRFVKNYRNFRTVIATKAKWIYSMTSSVLRYKTWSRKWRTHYTTNNQTEAIIHNTRVMSQQHNNYSSSMDWKDTMLLDRTRTQSKSTCLLSSICHDTFMNGRCWYEYSTGR